MNSTTITAVSPSATPAYTLKGYKSYGEFNSAAEAEAWADKQETSCFQATDANGRQCILRRRTPKAFTAAGEIFVPHIPAWMDGPVVKSLA